MKLNDLRSMFSKDPPPSRPKATPATSFGSEALIDHGSPSRETFEPIGRALGPAVKVITIGGMEKWHAVETRLKRTAVALGWPSDIRIVRIPRGSGLVKSGDDILIIGHRGTKRSITFTMKGRMYRRRITYTIPEP